MAFYESLGFRLDEKHSSVTAPEIVNEFGVRMNLILNGEPTALRDNVLMDHYSSWSMRAWLLLKTPGVPFTEVTIPLYRTESREAVRALRERRVLIQLR
jgi:hypothetical protein